MQEPSGGGTWKHRLLKKMQTVEREQARAAITRVTSDLALRPEGIRTVSAIQVWAAIRRENPRLAEWLQKEFGEDALPAVESMIPAEWGC